MPKYSYVAINKNGQEKKGKVEAIDQMAVSEILKNNGLTPVKIQEQSSAYKNLNFSFGKDIKPRDLSVFCRQFVSIIQAGVSLKNALQMLSEQTENKTLKEGILEVLISVEKGNTLSDGMRGQSHIFPELLIDMVAAGEISGNLEMSFNRMAIQFEKEAKLRATIKKATIYPIILILASIGVVLVMLLFVIPSFIEMFAEIDGEMPLVTTLVIHASEWLGNYWYVLALIVILIVFAYKMYYKTVNGKLTVDKIKMKTPLFGKLIVKSVCAQFARTTGTLISTGIPMIDCLEIISRILTNVHYSNALMEAREEVMKGVPLTEPIKESGLFPPMVYHMIGIGEETGNMENMLEKLADYYDEEVEMTTQAVLAAMEPMIIVVMSVIVGFLVIAILAPLASLYNGLM